VKLVPTGQLLVKNSCKEFHENPAEGLISDRRSLADDCDMRMKAYGTVIPRLTSDPANEIFG
jgi:hypothetical protein